MALLTEDPACRPSGIRDALLYRRHHRTPPLLRCSARLPRTLPATIEVRYRRPRGRLRGYILPTARSTPCARSDPPTAISTESAPDYTGATPGRVVLGSDRERCKGTRALVAEKRGLVSSSARWPSLCPPPAATRPRTTSPPSPMTPAPVAAAAAPLSERMPAIEIHDF